MQIEIQNKHQNEGMLPVLMEFATVVGAWLQKKLVQKYAA